MATKKGITNIDPPSENGSSGNINVADNYYKHVTETPSTSKTVPKEKKNLGGRPKKDGLKNEQFTLTMHPEMYEKLRILAEEHTRGNFSGLIDETIKSFCREHDIDLSAVQVAPEILDMYKKKQEKKRKKK